jgi:outer membrane lipoprotein-sorting protein
MANAIDFYDAVAVRFVGRQVVGERALITESEITMRLRPNPGARSRLLTPDRELISVFDGTKLLQHDKTSGTYRVMPVAKEAERGEAPSRWEVLLNPKRWLSLWKKGQAVGYRQAPAIIRSPSANALFPQQEALALLGRSSVTINGEEALLGRSVIKLTAMTSEVHRDLWDTVRFWVDTQTGILLKQEYWKDGKLVEDQVATELTVNPNLDPSGFEIEIPKGAKELPPPG